MVSEQSGETLRFSAPPHIKASVFADKDIFFADGNSVFVESEKENADDYKVTDLYAKTKKERKTGECASMLPCFKTDGEEYSALNIKYKLPAFALINALKAIKGNTSELYFVFSVQKCLAARGVRALMQSGIYFDKVLSVNCIEETEENAEGVVVMAIEKSCVSTPEIRKGILRLAEEKKIPVRVGFTLENFSMKLYITEGQGTPCGLLCIPLKENSVKINNVKAAADLIAAMCEE